MSNYIDLDSTHRKRDLYPNPCDYVVQSDQVSSWNRESRKVVSHSTRPGAKTTDFVQSIQIKHVILPYTDITYHSQDGNVINSHTADLQRMYLNVYTERFNDKHLLSTIDNKVSKANFVLTQEKIQFDSSGDPAWIFFSSRMDQVMRFSRNESLVVQLRQEEGKIIIIEDMDPVDKSLQTYVLIEVTPIIRDGDYNDVSTGLTQF